MFIAFKPYRSVLILNLCLIIALATSSYYNSFDFKLQHFQNIAIESEVYIDLESELKKALLEAEKRGLADESTFECLRQLADYYHQLGDYHPSESYYNILLTRMKTKYGASDFRLASVMDELAEVYFEEGKNSSGNDFRKVEEDPLLKSAKNEFDKAEILFKECLKLRIKRLGTENIVVARTHLKIGRVFNAQAELKKAEGKFFESLAVFESAVGPNDPALVEVLSELVFFYNQEPLDFVLKNSEDDVNKLKERCERIFKSAYQGNYHRATAIKSVKGRALVGKVSLRMRDETNFGHDADISFPVVMGLKPSIQKKVQKELSLYSVFGDYDEELSGWVTDINYEVTCNQNNILSIEYRVDGCGAYPSWRYEYVCVDLKTGRRLSLSDVLKQSSLDTVAKLIDSKMKASAHSEISENPEDEEYIKLSYNQALTHELNPQAEDLAPFTKENLGLFSVYDSGIKFRFDFEFAHVAKAEEPENDYMIPYEKLKPHLKPDGPLGFLSRN